MTTRAPRDADGYRPPPANLPPAPPARGKCAYCDREVLRRQQYELDLRARDREIARLTAEIIRLGGVA